MSDIPMLEVSRPAPADQVPTDLKAIALEFIDCVAPIAVVRVRYRMDRWKR